MSGFKAIPREIREQILARIKEGISVSQLSSEHGVSTKTIYGWLAKESIKTPGFLTVTRLRREKEDLLKLVGELALRLARGEKNQARW